MGLVRKVWSLWAHFYEILRTEKCGIVSLSKRWIALFLWKKLYLQDFFPSQHWIDLRVRWLPWFIFDQLGKQIQFIWLVRRRGGVGIRSWIYILQTTQNNIPQNDWFDFQAKKMWVWIASKLCCSSFCFALTSIRWTIDLFSEQGFLCQRADNWIFCSYRNKGNNRMITIDWEQKKGSTKFLTKFCKGGSPSVPSWASNQPLGQVGKVRWTDNLKNYIVFCRFYQLHQILQYGVIGDSKQVNLRTQKLLDYNPIISKLRLLACSCP